MQSLASALSYRLPFVSVSCSQSPQFRIYRLVVATGDSDNHSSLFLSLSLSQRSPRLSKVLAASLRLLFGSRRHLCRSRDWVPCRPQLSLALGRVPVLVLQVPSLFVLGIVLALGFSSHSVPDPFVVYSRDCPSFPHFANSLPSFFSMFYPSSLHFSNDLPRSRDLT